MRKRTALATLAVLVVLSSISIMKQYWSLGNERHDPVLIINQEAVQQFEHKIRDSMSDNTDLRIINSRQVKRENSDRKREDTNVNIDNKGQRKTFEIYNKAKLNNTLKSINESKVPDNENGNRLMSLYKKPKLALSGEHQQNSSRSSRKNFSFVTVRKFTSTERSRIFILGAVVKNSSEHAVWDRVAVYGEWYQSNKSEVKCCVKYSNGSVFEAPVYESMPYNEIPKTLFIATLIIWHVTCQPPVPGYVMGPTHVSITRDYSCDSPHVKYVTPLYVQRKPTNYTVITTKLAYLKMDPEIVYNFLENAKLIGIDKVVTYVDRSLDDNIEKILMYYASIGLLDYQEMYQPDTKRVPREKAFQTLSFQYINDEWMVKKDALERNVGATYFGIYDMDELLLITKNRTVKDLMADLLSVHPTASHVFFKSIHYLTDHHLKSPFCDSKCSIFQKYTMLSPQLNNGIHEKMFLIPSRTRTSTINNHYITSLPGYQRGNCPEEEALIRHYGLCKRKFIQHVCQNGSQPIKQDTSMIPWSEKFLLPNVRKSMTEVNSLNISSLLKLQPKTKMKKVVPNNNNKSRS